MRSSRPLRSRRCSVPPMSTPATAPPKNMLSARPAPEGASPKRVRSAGIDGPKYAWRAPSSTKPAHAATVAVVLNTRGVASASGDRSTPAL